MKKNTKLIIFTIICIVFEMIFSITVKAETLDEIIPLPEKIFGPDKYTSVFNIAIFIICAIIVIFLRKVPKSYRENRDDKLLRTSNIVFQIALFFMIITPLMDISSREMQSVIMIIITPIFIIISLIISKVYMKIFYPESERENDEPIRDTLHDKYENATDMFINEYPNINTFELLRNTFNIYNDVQMARMNFNYNTLQGLLSEELFDRYRKELKGLERRKEKEIVKEISFLQSYITSYEQNNNIMVLNVVLEVLFKGYTINTKTNKIVSGSEFEDNDRTYLLTIITDESNKIILANKKRIIF